MKGTRGIRKVRFDTEAEEGPRLPARPSLRLHWKEFLTLDIETRISCMELHRRLAQEAQGADGDKPLKSIVRALTKMTPQDFESLVDLYERAEPERAKQADQ